MTVGTFAQNSLLETGVLVLFFLKFDPVLLLRRLNGKIQIPCN